MATAIAAISRVLLRCGSRLPSRNLASAYQATGISLMPYDGGLRVRSTRIIRWGKRRRPKGAGGCARRWPRALGGLSAGG